MRTRVASVLLANANVLSLAVAQGDEPSVQRPRACGDPRLWIRSVTFTGLPDLLAALAGAPPRAETLGSGSGSGSGSGRVARALLAVFQRGRQIWSGAVLGVRPWAWLHFSAVHACLQRGS